MNMLSYGQITKAEAFTTGTKLSFYPNECGNTIPEADGKLTFCDRANNLGVVERSYGLNDRRANRMLSNHFNEDEFYVTGNGLSIRKTDATWENIPNIAVPLWGSTYLPTINTGLVLPDGKVIIQATNAGYLFNVYDRNLKTFTAVNFPNNKYPQQLVYDTDRGLTWAFATSGSTTYLFAYNSATSTLTEIASLGFIGIGGNSINLIYNDDHIYLGNSQGLYKIDVSDYMNSVPVTHYDSTTTPSLPFDRVNDLQFDANNDLWMANSGTNDGGIVKFNITNETYDLYQTPRPDNAAINIRFDKLALDETGLIWATSINNSGLVKLTFAGNTPNWTLLPSTDLTVLGVPITYNPNNIYFRNNKFYFTTTDFSSGSNNNFEVIINDDDVWSGRNDNELGNLSQRMNYRFTNCLPDANGGVWWFNAPDDIVVHRDADDNHQSILIENLGYFFAAAIDVDNKAIVKGGNPHELRKIDFPNTNSIQVNTNEANDMERVLDQIWIFDRGNKKIDAYKNDVLIHTYNLDEDWYQYVFNFAVDDDGNAWFMQNNSGSLIIKKFDTQTLTTTTYDAEVPDVSLSTLRKVVSAPNGGVWFIGTLGAVYQENGVFYDFMAADYPEIYRLYDIVVDTNGKAYLLNNDNASITTIENPTVANPTLTNIDIEANNTILPSLDHYRPAALTIDSEGSVWTHASLNTFKLIDNDLATEYIPQPAALGINKEEFDSKLSIYPNPTDGIINIKTNFQIEKIEAFSILGRKIKTIKNTNTIDLSNQSAGIYLLKITLEGRIINKKVVLQ